MPRSRHALWDGSVFWAAPILAVLVAAIAVVYLVWRPSAASELQAAQSMIVPPGGMEVSHTFRVYNHGDKGWPNLALQGKTCSCIASVVSSGRVRPGEYAHVTLKSFIASVNKSHRFVATYDTGLDEHPPIALTLDVQARPQIGVTPLTLRLQDLSPGATVERQVEVLSAAPAEKGPQSTRARPSSSRITAKRVSEQVRNEGETISVIASYRLTLDVPDDILIGYGGGMLKDEVVFEREDGVSCRCDIVWNPLRYLKATPSTIVLNAASENHRQKEVSIQGPNPFRITGTAVTDPAVRVVVVTEGEASHHRLLCKFGGEVEGQGARIVTSRQCQLIVQTSDKKENEIVVPILLFSVNARN